MLLKNIPRLTLFLRLFWICFISALFLFALNSSIFLIIEYFERKVVTLNTIRQVQSIAFPNITFCPKHVDALNFVALKKDLRRHLPLLPNHKVDQLMIFAMAGAGFHHFDAHTQLMKQSEIYELANLFRQWRDTRSNAQFFKFFFEDNGFKCEQFFDSCYHGKRKIRCCDLFSHNYIMLRGRCFVLREFFQTAPDESGKLTFFFKRMKSPFLDTEGIQKQIVAYVSHNIKDIPTFPRFYLNTHTWYRIRMKKRQISMLSPNLDCSTDRRYTENGNCYVESWLRECVINQLNCTVFYLAHKNPELEVCDPEVIVLNYRSVMNVNRNRSSFRNLTTCLPPCQREIIDTQLHFHKFQHQKSNINSKNVFFHFEASYDNLQVEHYKELLTTTAPGFISQLGGQLSLFLGISLVSIIQSVVIPVANFLLKKFM